MYALECTDAAGTALYALVTVPPGDAEPTATPLCFATHADAQAAADYLAKKFRRAGATYRVVALPVANAA